MAQQDHEKLETNLATLHALRAELGRDGPFAVTLYGVRATTVER